MRTYRSTEPSSGFVAYDGTAAMTNTSTHHGNSFILGYSLDADGFNYNYTSIGHTSLYTAYNMYGEAVDINAAHTREYAKDGIATEDAQLATRQIWLIGNVAIHNPVAYTNDGWPTAFPLPYDETFSTTNKGANYSARTYFTAYDIEGVYETNVFADNYDGAYVETSQDFTIVATDNTHGTVVNNTASGAGQGFTLTYSADNKTTYITLYEADGTTVHASGVIANQGTLGSAVPEFSYLIHESVYSQQCQHVWGVKVADYPRDSVNAPEGIMVEMDQVVYTHATDAEALAITSDATAPSYALYGQEISDQITYALGTTDGERVTTFKVKWPYYVDEDNANSVICLNDADFVAKGYKAGNYSLKLVGFYDASGNALDTQTPAYYADNGADGYYAYYRLTGKVSTYFHYFNNETDPVTGTANFTGYPETGLQLLVTYRNKAGSTYGEYKFPFVMPNPAEAHTIVGIRNKYTATFSQNSRVGLAMFTRLDGSYGLATSLQPVAYNVNSNATVDGSNGTVQYGGTGNFKYLAEFPNTTDSIADSNYSGAAEINNQFKTYTAAQGVNSGAYHLLEHYNSGMCGSNDSSDKAVYGASANVVNADYYIDYSDTKNSLIARDGSDNPTGYNLNFFASNFYWQSSDSLSETRVPSSDGSYTGDDWSINLYRATSYVKNATLTDEDTPLTLTVNTPTLAHGRTDKLNNKDNKFYYLTANTWYSDESNSSKLPISSAKNWLLNSQGTVADSNYQTILKTMTSDGTADYSKLTPAFSVADSTLNETAGWQGTMTLAGTGFADVAKATGNTAEAAHNFAYEQGVKIKANWLNGYGVTSEETFHYYNIGVETCDKGAVREFVDTWLNKEMTITRDSETGKVTALAEKTVTTDDVDSVYINAANYTVASYDAYLDAVAEAYWFLNNPKNTHMQDYDSTKADTRYTTAYGTTPGGDSHAFIYADEKGADIFGENSSTNHTDEVQAKIISNVIEAYENLFNITNYTAAEETYGKIQLLDDGEESSTVANVDEIKIYETSAQTGEPTADYPKANFTEDSWTAFVQLVVDVTSAFNYYTSEASGSKQTSWRYVELTGEEYNDLTAILNAAQSTLVEKVKIATLQNTYNDSNTAVAAGIFTGENNAQSYTYASWAALNAELPTAYAYLNSGAGTYAPAQTADAKVYDTDGKLLARIIISNDVIGIGMRHVIVQYQL